VALFGRDLERLTGSVAQLEANGHSARAFQADAGDAEDLTAALVAPQTSSALPTSSSTTRPS
jgi:hypothetical protein